MKNKFFQLARNISKHSDHPAHQLGAFIVKGNRIISLGFNKNKTHTKSNHAWKRLHAEICAIIKTKEDLTGCTIYVYRETKLGNLGMARPCPTCLAAIQEVGIKKICYSTENGYKQEII
jgi:deoxycytidylate deaminase